MERQKNVIEKKENTKITKPLLLKGKKNKKAKKQIIIWVVVIFVAFFFIIARYSYITQLNYDVALLEKSIIEKEAVNSGLTIELDNLMNLPQVRYIAKSQLGMQKPDNYQTVYIEVPRSDKVYKASESYGLYDRLLQVLDDVLVSLNNIKNIFG